MTPAKLVVVGGGLAGLSAALVAADAGAEVTLLEARPRLGGLTVSFERDGMEVDTGQHVFLRCCNAYRGFLRRVGVEHLTTLQPRLDVPVVIGSTGARARLRRTRMRLPAPLHLAPALLGYAALPLGERVRASLAAFRIGRLDPADPRVDGQSFGSWLRAHGQGPAATEALWELLTVATLNATADHSSLGLAAKVVRTGLLEKPDAGDIGWSNVPLSRLHGAAAAAALRSAGASVRLGVKVRGIERAESGAGWVVTTDEGPAGADAVVLATSPTVAASLLPPGAVPGQERFADLGEAPIVNVHLVYDRRVMAGPFLAAVGSPAQWVFDRTESSGLAATHPDWQYLAVSLSAADEWVERTVGELRPIFDAELRRLLPATAGARLVRFFVTRERSATFRPSPGSRALRPPQATPLPGLALAGAWTATDWPATMEGAVRSGLAAAVAALNGGSGSGVVDSGVVDSGVVASPADVAPLTATPAADGSSSSAQPVPDPVPDPVPVPEHAHGPAAHGVPVTAPNGGSPA
jgi:squalene-associated FAD-dependent desaturase